MITLLSRAIRGLSPSRSILAALVALTFLAGCQSVEERVAQHLEIGRALIEDGESGKALLEFRSALQLDEDVAAAYLEIAKIHEARGETQAAYAHYRKAADLDPENSEAQLKLAGYLLMQGSPDAAAKQVASVLEREPDNAEAKAIEASVAMAADDLEMARARMDEALALSPENRTVRMIEISLLSREGDLDAALSRADEALTLFPDDAGLHQIKLGLLDDSGDAEGITAQLKTMIETFPDELEYRHALVTWAMDNGDATEVERQLRALLEAQPDSMQALGDLLGFVRREHGDAAAREVLTERIDAAADPLSVQLLLADFDAATGNRDRAIALLEDLAAQEGDATNPARTALARMRIEDGDMAAADALIAAVLATDPKNVDALRLRVARLIEQDALEEAIQAVRTAFDEAPDDIQLLLLEARAQERMGNLDLAGDRFAQAVRVAEYAPALAIDYTDFLARIGRPEAIRAVLSEAVERAPGNVALIDQLARTELALEDWQGAERTIAKLEPLAPARARALKAAVFIGQERFDESRTLLRDADDDGSMTAIVGTYLRESGPDAAAEFLDEILVRTPENLQALGLRGNLHQAAGEFDQARARYQDILEIDPDNATAYAALSQLATRQDDLDEAQRLVREGLEQSPGNLMLLAEQAQLYERKGAFDPAIEIYEQLHDIAPDALGIANNLANLLADHRGDDPKVVKRAYQIAGRLRPSTNLAHRDTYGWTRYLRGEYEEARDFIVPVAEALPQNPWARYHAGMVYAALDQPDLARTNLEAALDLSAGGNFPPAETIRTTLARLASQ